MYAGIVSTLRLSALSYYWRFGYYDNNCFDWIFIKNVKWVNTYPLPAHRNIPSLFSYWKKKPAKYTTMLSCQNNVSMPCASFTGSFLDEWIKFNDLKEFKFYRLFCLFIGGSESYLCGFYGRFWPFVLEGGGEVCAYLLAQGAGVQCGGNQTFRKLQIWMKMEKNLPNLTRYRTFRVNHYTLNGRFNRSGYPVRLYLITSAHAQTCAQ